MPKRKRKEKDGSKVSVKFKGVIKIGMRFRAQIGIDGKTQNLGTFDTPKEAARAFNRAAMQAGRPPSKLNFLDQVSKIYKPKNNGLSSTNTTGFRGVYKRKNKKGKNSFIVQIWIGDKNHYIGTFDTSKEAAIAYDFAALQAKRPTSDLNFPDMIHVKKKISKKTYRKIMKSSQESSNTGVCKDGNKFKAQIQIAGNLQNIGKFDTAKEAAEVYDQAALQAKLNVMIEKEKKNTIPKRKNRKMMKSSFNGVSKIGKRYVAKIRVDGKPTHLGSFAKARDAAMAYDMAIVELSGKSMDTLKSLLNFPNGLAEEEEKM